MGEEDTELLERVELTLLDEFRLVDDELKCELELGLLEVLDNDETDEGDCDE